MFQRLLGQFGFVGGVHLLHLQAQLFGGHFVAEDQVHGPAQQREQPDQNDPDDLVGAVLVLADKVEHDEQAEQLQPGVDPHPARRQGEEGPQQPPRLQQNKGHRNGSPVEDPTKKFDERQTEKHLCAPLSPHIRV